MKAVGLGIFCVIISLQLVCEADATESSSKHAYGNYDNGAYGVYGRGFATPTFLPSEPDIFLYIYTENADHSWTVRRSPTPALVRNSNTQENTQVNSNAVETTENSVNTRNTQHPQSSPTRGDESHGSEKFSTDMLFVSQFNFLLIIIHLKLFVFYHLRPLWKRLKNMMQISWYHRFQCGQHWFWWPRERATNRSISWKKSFICPKTWIIFD